MSKIHQGISLGAVIVSIVLCLFVTMFTETTVFCNSIKQRLSQTGNNYAGMLKNHRGNIRQYCLFEMLRIVIVSIFFF